AGGVRLSLRMRSGLRAGVPGGGSGAGIVRLTPYRGRDVDVRFADPFQHSASGFERTHVAHFVPSGRRYRDSVPWRYALQSARDVHRIAPVVVRQAIGADDTADDGPRVNADS